MTTRLSISTGFRKTAEGIELTGRAIGGLVMLIVLTSGFIAFIARTAHPVQQREFQDTVKAIRNDLLSTAGDAKTAAQNAQAVSCWLARYPAGLCDNVPRAMQAGEPRDGTTTHGRRNP